MKKKIYNKGATPSFMVGIIAGLIVILALIMVFGKLLPIMSGAGEAKICEYNLFITAATKTPIIQNINIPPECQMKRITLTYDELAKNKAKAQKEIKKHNDKFEKTPEFKFSYDIKNDDDLLRYEMDKAIAKELRTCWQTGWEGNMNFFDEWWRFYEPFWGEDEVPGQETLIDLFVGEFKRPPINCIACARIKFDDDLKARFQNENIKTINEWMQKTPIPADPEQKSYWEYTLPDQSLESIYRAGERFDYDTDKTYLIAFARVNVHKGAEYVRDVIDLFPGYSEDDHPEDISTLILIPYEDANEYCTFMIG